MTTRAVRLRVTALIIRDGRVLVVEHSKGGRNYLMLPGGGVDPGERLTAALTRELAEELDLAITPGDLVLACDTIQPEGGRHIVHLVFQASATGEPRVTGSDERVTQFHWMTGAELATATFYPDVLDWLLTALSSGDSLPRAPYRSPAWR